ncbi:hypothetical protein EX30DRAFT_342453 [Ascodesmis nigricans]|uniref:Uncharacterized protein n=1 Tax=Ascodesmis nigricans TaxID=341454 RepID=A0A4S2MS84_9PEZI|nr:hypothetical protein EX30DRAFT_342453 [Ascodesmis nigricans]
MVDDTELDLFITTSLDTLLTTTSFIHHFLLTTSPPPSTLPRTFTHHLTLLQSLKTIIISTSLLAAFPLTHKTRLLTLTTSLEVRLSIYTKIKTSCHWNPPANNTSAIFPPLLHLSSLTRAAFSPTAVEELVKYYKTWIQEIIDFLPFPVAQVVKDWDAYEEEIRCFTTVVERGEELLGVKEVLMVQRFLSERDGRWISVLKEVGGRCREFDSWEIEFVSALKGEEDIRAGYVILQDESGGGAREEKKRIPVLLQRHPRNSSRQHGIHAVEPTGDMDLDSAIHATRSHLQHKSTLSQLCTILSLLSASPAPGIPSLTCTLTPLGYLHHPSTSSSYIIFRLPSSIISWDNHSFRTLHTLINPTTTADDDGKEEEEEGITILGLGARFRLGESVARIIMRLHQSGSAHGAIRSQNVIFLFPRDAGGEGTEREERICHMGGDGWKFDTPILMGGQITKNLCHRVSSVGNHNVGDASLTGDGDGGNSGGGGDGISLRNDLYDLGVLLLELGTWTSAAAILSLDTEDANDTDTNTNTNTPPPKATPTPTTPSARKSFTTYAANTLGETMGARYRDLVVDLLHLGNNEEGDCDGTGDGTGEPRESEAEQWWARKLGVLCVGREL